MATVTINTKPSKPAPPPEIESVTLVLSKDEAARVWALCGSDANDYSYSVYQQLNALASHGVEYEYLLARRRTRS